jgi:hypothetical protein
MSKNILSIKTMNTTIYHNSDILLSRVKDKVDEKSIEILETIKDASKEISYSLESEAEPKEVILGDAWINDCEALLKVIRMSTQPDIPIHKEAVRLSLAIDKHRSGDIELTTEG